MANETVPPWMLSVAVGLILTKSLAAPLVRYRRGLSWQNLLLRPAVLISPGLILAKSLSAPRWSEIPGAYSDKISF